MQIEMTVSSFLRAVLIHSVRSNSSFSAVGRMVVEAATAIDDVHVPFLLPRLDV